MKKGTKTLLILAVVFVILCGGYYFAIKWQPNSGEIEAGEDNTIYLINNAEEDIESIEISNAEFNYEFLNTDKILLSGFKSSILSDELVNYAFSNLCTITATKRIDGATELEDYGIGDGISYVTYKFKDGTEKTLIIGDNAHFESEYYVYEKSSNAVYTVSENVYSILTMNPRNLLDMLICSIDAQSISEIEISGPKGTVLKTRMDKNKNYYKENVSIPTFVIEEPYNDLKASLDKILALTEKFGTLYANEIVEENPDTLNKYGLNSPFILNVKDNNKTHTLKLGAKDESGLVYMMYNDENVVYLAECLFYDDITNAKAIDFTDRFIHLCDISEVSELEIKYNKAITLLSINSNDNKYKKNGKFIAEKKLKNIYESVIAISFSDFADNREAGELMMELTFTINGIEKTYKYYEYDERYAVVKMDSGYKVLTLKKNIENVINNLK